MRITSLEGPSQSGDAESLLRAVLDTVPDAMVVIDVNGIIRAFSKTAEGLFGFREADLIGKNVSTLMPSPDRDRHDRYIERYVQTGEARIIGIGRVVVGQRYDGSKFPMQLSVGDASNSQSKMFVGFIRDLTRRQETEIRLEELQHELEHVSRVSVMGTMATALAHELNQPLTAIANYVEAGRDLLEKPTEENIRIIRDALGDAAQQSLRAGQIVRRLREFIARGESEKRVESLRTIVNDANALALIGTKESGIDVLIDIDDRIHQVLVDRVQIQQVIVNLVRNAVDAMTDSATRKLNISAIPADENLVEVQVADNGSGIDIEMESVLFSPFASSKVSGMGLGLSICQSIIMAHGGSIWYSRPDRGGTVFHFTLPTAQIETIDDD